MRSISWRLITDRCWRYDYLNKPGRHVIDEAGDKPTTRQRWNRAEQSNVDGDRCARISDRFWFEFALLHLKIACQHGGIAGKFSYTHKDRRKKPLRDKMGGISLRARDREFKIMPLRSMNLSFRQIGAQLGISHVAAYKRYGDGRKSLRWTTSRGVLEQHLWIAGEVDQILRKVWFNCVRKGMSSATP
jgi:hypothetical protein